MKIEESKLKKDIRELLENLCSIIAPSGREHEVRKRVIELLKPVADSIWIDALGNVIAMKKGRKDGRKIMLAAHMDEIGFFVSHIDDKGFLRILPIGGIHERTIVYQRVLIKTRDGKIYRGVIGLKPPHIAKPEEARQIPELKELFVDVGAKSREDVNKMGVRVGDIVVFDREIVDLGNDRITGKSLDDRVGLAILIKVFELIENNEVDVYAVATVQEEVGLKGARTAAFSISPHVALALDVTIASDVPGVAEHEWVTQLGKGPAIKIADGRNAMGLIGHPEVVNKLIEIAEEMKIPYQISIAPGGTTDASIIALNKEGVPAAVVAVPSRYIHSPIEVVDLNDVVNTIKLVKGFIEDISIEWIDKIRGFKIK
ncbi:MAG TPA: M42 family peptidase [Ignisphaera sp.]|nr:M42 family peptidase [Ignisphaera sp.]